LNLIRIVFRTSFLLKKCQADKRDFA